MHTTQELYRRDVEDWKNLTYTDALGIRAQYAQDAMRYYKGLADVIGNKFRSRNYTKLMNQFNASKKARDFNIQLLEEALNG